MKNIIFGNCLEKMDNIKSKSIQLIIADPPYGTTPLEWDNVLDFEKLWEHYNRIIKDDGVICIFGQEPFSSYVRLSNIDNYKYDWYWVKERLTNVFQVKRRPGKVVETISVFYKNQCKYNPQKIKYEGKRVTNEIGNNVKFSIPLGGKAAKNKPTKYIDNGTRNINQVLNINRDNIRNSLIETQKPVLLIEILIKSYTDKNDIVLDNVAGSGTTGIACINTNRKYILIENNIENYKIIKSRIKAYI